MTTLKQTALKQSKDQILGKTQAAGLKPAVNGIAARRLAGLASRAVGVADAVGAILAARDSGDPALTAIAAKLLENKEFIRSMISAVEEIKASIKQPAAKTDTAPAATIKPTSQVGPNYEESDSPNNQPDPERGSGLPGTDSAAAPGSYSVTHLMRDLEASNHAAVMAAQSNPKMSMDAAAAAATAMQFIPAWGSNTWDESARQHFRDRASYDGAAAAHIAKAGDLPTYVRDYDARRNADELVERFGVKEAPARPDRPFDR
jgi:hypothetical protein